MKKTVFAFLCIMLMASFCLCSCNSSKSEEESTSEKTFAEESSQEEENIEEAAGLEANLKTGEVKIVTEKEQNSEEKSAESIPGDGDISKLKEEMQAAIDSAKDDENTLDFGSMDALYQLSDTIIGKDDRKTVSSKKRTRYPYCAIVHLSTTFPNGKQYEGTGYMMGRNTIVTAAHVIYHKEDRKGSGNGFATSVKISPARKKDDYPYGVSYATLLVVPWQYANNTTNDGRYTDVMRNYDYGVINVDNNLGDRIGWFGWTDFDSLQVKDKEYYQVGYYHKKMFSQKGHKVYAHESPLLYTYFDHGRGQSGSPIYYKKGGNYYVVGHTIAGKDRYNIGRYMNREMSDFINQYKK